MACDSCVLGYTSGLNLLAVQKIELGPAYEDYMRGEVYIPRVFHDRRRIPNFLVPWCCADVPFNIHTDRPTMYLSLMAVWWSLSFFLFLLYWPKRHSYPLNFRSPPTFLVLWLALGTGNAFSSVNAAAGLSCNCHLYLTATQIILPVQMYYLTYKSVQLYFAYSWNFAKMMNMQQRVKAFTRYKWIMTDKPFLIGVTVLVVLGAIIHTVEMTSLSMFSPTLNQIFSLRTFWWQIPLKYQKPTTLDGTRGSMCVCWDLALVTTGDTSVAALNTTTQELTAACATSYFAYCVHTPTCAAACPINGLSSSKCGTWLIEYFATGVCGYPEEFVNISAAKTCFGVYRPVFIFYMAIYQLFLVSNFILMCLISRMDDQLYLRFELVAASLIGVPGVNLIFFEYLSPDVKDYFLRVLPTVSFELLIAYTMNFVGLLLNVAFPIALAYKYDLLESPGSSIADTSRNESESSIFDTEAIRLPYNDELMFALNNDAAAEIYQRFSWKEFTVENLKFLKAVKGLMDRFNDDVNPYEIVLEGQNIYETFIKKHSSMEVNLPGAMREAITHAWEGSSFQLLLNHQDSSATQDQEEIVIDIFSSSIPESVERKDQQIDLQEKDLNLKEEMKAWLQPAVREIKRLILRDSWLRFRKSSSFPQFAELLNQHKAFDDALRRLRRPLIAPETSHQQRLSTSTTSVTGIDLHLDAKLSDETILRV